MSSNDWRLPFTHLTQGQKYFPPSVDPFSCVKCKKLSNLFWYSSLMRNTLIQLRSMFCSLSYQLRYDICMKISLFHIKVRSSPIQEHHFLLHLFIQVKHVIINLMKFRQHFALVSKYTKWKRSHQLTTIKYAPRE